MVYLYILHFNFSSTLALGACLLLLYAARFLGLSFFGDFLTGSCRRGGLAVGNIKFGAYPAFFRH